MWKNPLQTSVPPRAAEPDRPNFMPPPTVPEPVRPAGVGASEQATIGKSLLLKGEVSGSESLYIDGRVEGTINLPGNRVTIGRNGSVTANINAREVVILGKVRGNLAATDRVEIRSEGSLTGDVVAARIAIEDGAFFKGGIDIRKTAAKVAGDETVGAPGMSSPGMSAPATSAPATSAPSVTAPAMGPASATAPGVTGTEPKIIVPPVVRRN